MDIGCGDGLNLRFATAFHSTSIEHLTILDAGGWCLNLTLIPGVLFGHHKGNFLVKGQVCHILAVCVLNIRRKTKLRILMVGNLRFCGEGDLYQITCVESMGRAIHAQIVEHNFVLIAVLYCAGQIFADFFYTLAFQNAAVVSQKALQYSCAHIFRDVFVQRNRHHNGFSRHNVLLTGANTDIGSGSSGHQTANQCKHQDQG